MFKEKPNVGSLAGSGALHRNWNAKFNADLSYSNDISLPLFIVEIDSKEPVNGALSKIK